MEKDYLKEFEEEKKKNTEGISKDQHVKEAAKQFTKSVSKYKYGYYSTWLGRPIIQLPQDMIALQELVFSVKPDLIIETGIAHGGSIVFSASLLALLGGEREVLGIDIEIREHNRKAIEAHPMFHRITMLEGSSVEESIIQRVHEIAAKHHTIMLLLDSCHTHEHVLKELNAYAGLVTPGSYAVVYDTCVEFLDEEITDRPWGKGNNPYTAVQEFLKQNDSFQTDTSLEDKMVLTSCPGGWLKRVN